MILDLLPAFSCECTQLFLNCLDALDLQVLFHLKYFHVLPGSGNSRPLRKLGQTDQLETSLLLTIFALSHLGRM